MKVFHRDLPQKIGQSVLVSGWVANRRDHGKVIFVDLRDRSGIIQLVFTPSHKKVYALAETLKTEWVIEAEGKVVKRPSEMVNNKIPTGEIELQVERVKILNRAEPLPFDINQDTRQVDEKIRMEYRYLDLRSERMTKNLFLRYKVIQFIREYLDKKGFWEIETPILTKSTPEGARDYLVPSRQHPGQFYALPQSPQQMKQILMVAGIERYFQIARCFRDEDPRGDRQPEFTQLDIEVSFMTQNELLDLVEDLFINLVKKVTPEKRITQIPFPRLSYQEVMKKYHTDRPDLRKNKHDSDELAFAFVIDWPMFEYQPEEKRWDPLHHIFTAPKEEDLPLLETNPAAVRSWQHDLILNGYEVGGGSLRITDPEVQKKVLRLVGLSQDEIETRFGHLLKAFQYGVPPHGGIAPGIDRIVMILANEPNIREVIAFPKTGDGRDLMMEAPSEVSSKQLEELHLVVKK